MGELESRHLDQFWGVAQLVEHPALNRADASSTLASPANSVQWRNGNATVCKTVMSRIDTGLHLHALVAQRTRAAGFYPACQGFESSRGCQHGRVAQGTEQVGPNDKARGSNPRAITNTER